MATITVSLPDPMKDWIEAQIKGGQYASSSDYIRDLIRRDRERKDRRDQERQDRLEVLRQALEEGDPSGASPRSFDEVVEDARAPARAERKNG
jgi:antitoxin ParD1/3/4